MKMVMSVLKGIFKKIILNIIIVLAASFSFSHFSWSYGEGEMIPVGGPNIFNFNLSNTGAINNNIGTQVVHSWDLGESYSVNIFCRKYMSMRAIFYTAKTKMRPSSSNLGYLYFNDYFDVKVEVYISGGVKDYITVPFYDFSNKNSKLDCSPPYTQHNNSVGSGSKGRLTFLTTKPVINGVALSAVEVLELFGNLGSGPALHSQAVAKVVVKSGIISVPDKCVINKGTPITIEFGPVGSSSEKLNGQNYKQPLEIDVQCTGGSFSKGALNIKLALQTAGAGITNFNPDFFGTTGKADRKDLGIVIRNKNNQIVKPNTFYPIDVFSKNQGRWDLTAAPVANQGRDIPEGEFSSSATVVAEFN
ncbi:fimbrial protein [Erwinia sorbitola]|nr:fimbrial protein [Erwinia sorbitola]